jgi:mucin-like protein/ricin-type beta-trefoil lectin protein
MKKMTGRLVAVVLGLVSLGANADEFSDYLDACKSELNFDKIPQFSCSDVLFRPPPPQDKFAGPFVLSDDHVAHRAINNEVDAVFACRWVNEVTVPESAASGEMLIHNRVKGGTCFFQLKNENAGTTKDPHVKNTSPPSPTDALARDFWDNPSETAKTKCTRCHSTGPYIASAPIIPALSRFGIINNLHDIKGERYYSVGSIGPAFDEIARQSRFPLQSTCAGQCHLLGGTSLAGTKQSSIGTNAGFIVIPSINIAIDELTGGPTPNNFPILEHMPPSDPFSDFRWINVDGPNAQSPAGEGDFETVAAVQKNYPHFSCSNPSDIVARVADGPPDLISAATLPDKLNTFNLYDGLVCLNAEQGNGKSCHNYDVRYLCSDGTWTNWYDMDSPSYDGDHEERYKDNNVCTPTTAKPTLKAVGMQARAYKDSTNGPVPMALTNAPIERLKFDTKNGLVCRNQDQPDGKACSNYMVRFSCNDGAPPATYTFKSAWTGRAVTSTGAAADTKAQPVTQSWNTQGWILEPVASTAYYRLKNTGGGSAYLYAQSTAEQAKVVTAAASTSTLQQWAIESIANSSEVRIRNVGSNRYLTVADAALANTTPDFAPIYSQALSPSNWASQRWSIQ